MFLKGKSAIITGSTSGIGLAYAKALAAEGAAVMINGFGEPQAIEAERAALEAASGAKALYDPADMTKPNQIAAMAARAQAEFGGVDIAISNAARITNDLAIDRCGTTKASNAKASAA